jgi:hypothetical protein
MLMESAVGPRNAFGGTRTSRPCDRSRSTTPRHDEASAQAPCTSTIVGLVPAGDIEIPAGTRTADDGMKPVPKTTIDAVSSKRSLFDSLIALDDLRRRTGRSNPRNPLVLRHRLTTQVGPLGSNSDGASSLRSALS